MRVKSHRQPAVSLASQQGSNATTPAQKPRKRPRSKPNECPCQTVCGAHCAVGVRDTTTAVHPSLGQLQAM